MEEAKSTSGKRKLSLSLKNRFKKTSKEELRKMTLPQVPNNTSANTRWAIKNFTDWFAAHNRDATDDDLCPEEVLSPSCTADLLNRWLCVFISETRAHNGEEYPPRTLYSILTGILRYMRSNNPSYPNFLERESPEFTEFTATLDNLFKKLRGAGVGSSATHTEGISPEDEDLLWSSGVLNVETPLGLLRAVFYYNGKCFCLRGGQEHRDFKLSQLKRMNGPDRYIYYENSSKNRKGGISELRLEHKNVYSFANPEVGVRCHVFLLDLYIKKLPEDAHQKDLFYCRPLPNKPIDDEKPWYSAVPVGRNQLSKMVSSMCEEAKVEGKKTNHSLRVSGASTLFDAGVPENIIQSRTGHRSLDALRLYEPVTDDQGMKISKILSGNKENFCDMQTEKKKGLPDAPTLSCPNTATPSTAQYNNCTVIMPYPPYFPPYPSSCIQYWTQPSYGYNTFQDQPSICTPQGCPSDADYCQFPPNTNSGFTPLKNKN